MKRGLPATLPSCRPQHSCSRWGRGRAGQHLGNPRRSPGLGLRPPACASSASGREPGLLGCGRAAVSHWPRAGPGLPEGAAGLLCVGCVFGACQGCASVCQPGVDRSGASPVPGEPRSRQVPWAMMQAPWLLDELASCSLPSLSAPRAALGFLSESDGLHGGWGRAVDSWRPPTAPVRAASRPDPDGWTDGWTGRCLRQGAARGASREASEANVM